MSAYSPPTRRIPSCSSDYPQCEAKAHTLFPLPSHQIKTQNLSFLKRHRQIFSFRVLKRQFLLPFAQKQMKTLSVFAVALHPEGVDRNQLFPRLDIVKSRVALHPEGVDRNWISSWWAAQNEVSPSTRRAWIEMRYASTANRRLRSPSTRRAWIEIAAPPQFASRRSQSPSTRRAWIEIVLLEHFREDHVSPSTRRAWIEI